MGSFFDLLAGKAIYFGGGLLAVAQPEVALMILIGVTVGVVIGAIPGLGPAIVIAIALPLTYGMSPLAAVMLLLGIYVGGIYGGSVTAILINTPGTPAAAATVLDGYPLAKQGKAGKALQISLKSSTVGNFIAVLILMVVAFPLASLALMFGAPETFSLLIFAMTIIGGVAGESLARGLVAAFFGLLISTIGLDPISGGMRFTFGSANLQGGIQLLPMLTGIFAVSEVFDQARQGVRRIGSQLSAIPKSPNPADWVCSWKEFVKYWRTVIRSSLLGSCIGALPGIGAAVAAFISYGSAMRKSKERHLFGKGSLEGVCAAEAGNNAVCGAALIPLLTLGIPGDVVTAVLLGALILHGLTPGPLLFQQNPSEVYGLFLGLVMSCVVLYFVGKFILQFSRHLTSVPKYYMFPVVMVLCVVGSFAVQNDIFDVGVMLCFGIIGYFMKKYKYPAAPLLIAFLLGPMIENSLRQSLIMSRTGLMIFLTRPISVLFLVLTVCSILLIGFGKGRIAKVRKMADK